MIADCLVEHVKLLVANHLRVDHIAKGNPTNIERRQVGKMLGREIKQDGIDVAPGLTPHLFEGDADNNKHSIGWHHHYATADIYYEKDKNEISGVFLVLHHELSNFVGVEHLQKDD